MQDTSRERHFEFLRCEFEANGFLNDDPFSLGESLLNELVETIFEAEFEGNSPTHGALIFSHPIKEYVDFLPHRQFEEDSRAMAQAFCDGVSVFKTINKEKNGVIIFEHSIIDELALFTLRDDALYNGPNFLHDDKPVRDLFIIKKFEDGSITILCREGIAIHRAARLKFYRYQYDYKDLLKTKIESLWGEIPWAKQVLDSILRVAIHVMGPMRGVGGTMVLLHPSEDHIVAGNLAHESELLNNRNSWDFPWEPTITMRAHQLMLVNLMKNSDGATIIDPNGYVKTVRSWLVPPVASLAAEESQGGTRHLTAKVFSRHIKGLVFVVSSDGPISIYSDGERIVSTYDFAN